MSITGIEMKFLSLARKGFCSHREKGDFYSPLFQVVPSYDHVSEKND